MNWTEGNLARHTRSRITRGKETLLRQKKYFAKVRSGFANTTAKDGPSASIGKESAPRPPQSRGSKRRPSTQSLSPASQKRRRRDTSSVQSVTALPTVSGYFHSGSSDGRRRQHLGPQDNEDPQDLEKKRHRLLMRGDWVGVKMQKPIPVTFPRERRNGRVWDRSRRSSCVKPRHVLGDQLDKMRRNREANPFPNINGQQDVRVRIGSQVKESSSGSGVGRLRLGDNTSPISRHFPWSGNMWPRRSSLVESLEEQYANQLRRHPSPSSTSESSELHNSPSRVTRSLSDTYPHILTSSPLLLQPVPWRAIPQALIRTSSFQSESDGESSSGSIIAQVGREEFSATESQINYEMTWKTWIGQSSDRDDTAKSVDGSCESIERERISPGISEFPMNEANLEKIQSALDQPNEGTEASSTDQPEPAGSDLPSSDASLTGMEGQLAFTAQFKGPEKFPDVINCTVPAQSTDLVENPLKEVRVEYDAVLSPLDDFQHSTVARPNIPSSSPEYTVPQACYATQDQQIASGPLQICTANQLATQDSSSACQDSHIAWNMNKGDCQDASPGDSNENLPCLPERESRLASPNADTDLDKAWKHFIFADDSATDVEDTVYREVKRDIARDLRPSSTDVSQDIYIDAPKRDQGRSSVRTLPSSDADEIPRMSVEFLSSDDGSMSHRATICSQDATVHCIPSLNTHQDGDSSRVGIGHACNTTYTGTRSTSQAEHPSCEETLSVAQFHATETDLVSESASMMAEPSCSEAGGRRLSLEEHRPFKFAPPKLFIGKNSNPDRPRQLANHGSAKNRKRSGRTRRPACDGRANIKAVPNYHGDPIEDPEDEVRQASSGLFKALEME